MKLIHYMKLAIKKPYLVSSFLYKKHLGIILSLELEGIFNYKSRASVDDKQFSYRRTSDIDEIVNFYNNMGRNSITKEKTSEWLKKGNHCWLAYSQGEVIGGMWLFFDRIRIDQLSGRVLSKNKIITFNEHIGYQGYVVIDGNYRGKGIYTSFNNQIMNYYSKEKLIKKIILITGASNGAVIKTIMRSKGTMIGIVEVKNFIGIISRNEIFLDNSQKEWR